MKPTPFARSVLGAAAALALLAPAALQATTPLADQPIFANSQVPGNLALTLSVEFPTAVSVAHLDTTYDNTKLYAGYFDPAKCYTYVWHATETERHFAPAGLAGASRTCSDTGEWSGNFLNWATMQTIDPFRWVLTGGYRSKDTATETFIEKGWASGQGGTGNFPNRSLGSSTLVEGATPFNWSSMNMRIQGLGNKMRFTRNGNVNDTPTVYNPANGVDNNTVYEVSVRVKVCDTSPSAGPMEDNCTAYPAGNYKPTGLIQQYANRIRYSAFGYLNDSNKQRDGGVLRARQKFVGPTVELPNTAVAANPLAEWDASTGVFAVNPNPTDATDTNTAYGITTVTNSGVINYLNKFGSVGGNGTYKTYDNVSELYYAAIRYFKNLGNVPEWTDTGTASTSTKETWADGFPVIRTWDDPILYSCQRNFVLGIGDVNTWTDKNLPGDTGTRGEPTKPAAVIADTSIDVKVATDKVGSLSGVNANLGSATNNQEIPGSFYIAGLAYDSNTKDIRPDDSSKPQTLGKQTIQTYWLDVLEYSTYKANNQYYLATKYGGFRVPQNFDPYTRSTDIPQDWWSLTGEVSYGQVKPDNYFVAARPDDMIQGLTRAFASIAANLRAYTTSFSTALPQVTQSDAQSYSAQFDASNWTGELTAATTDFNPTTGEPTSTEAWRFSAKLDAQAAEDSGMGWSTRRRIVTWNDSTNDGVPFRDNSTGISAAQKAALNTGYRGGDDSTDYLNYLRGDRTHETSSTASASAKAYRARDSLLGDIVNSKPRVVGKPVFPYSDSSNPGYAQFRADQANRATMVYVGSNGGMLHAVNGATSGTDAGREVFAYVPGAIFRGPTGSPDSNGLASRGDPDFEHRYFVDATPVVFDIDFNRTDGASGSPDWRTVLVGGLGKGGRSYYAIDITTPPTSSDTETQIAERVLWEFSHADLGYTYGEPVAVKTAQYGWVLIFGSGYNNNDGKGYFFIVNPRTGALLQKIATGEGNASNQAGLAHVQAFILDRTDGTADSVYAGDLLGNLWRLDLRAGSGSYPAPTRLATLVDDSNVARPVTTRPLVVIQPKTNRRWVTVGTGRFLHASDIGSTQEQAMYAVMDGTALQFNATAPTGFTFPIGNSKLKQLTDLTQKVTLDLANEIGWYVKLGTGGGSALGWRVVNDPTSYYGVVEFTTMLPSGDVCNPSGSTRVYAIDLGDGQSTLVQADGTTPLAYSSALPGVATEQRSYSVEGKHRFVVCNNQGTCKNIQTRQPSSMGLRRLNWRELPLAN